MLRGDLTCCQGLGHQPLPWAVCAVGKPACPRAARITVCSEATTPQRRVADVRVAGLRRTRELRPRRPAVRPASGRRHVGRQRPVQLPRPDDQEGTPLPPQGKPLVTRCDEGNLVRSQQRRQAADCRGYDGSAGHQRFIHGEQISSQRLGTTTTSAALNNSAITVRSST